MEQRVLESEEKVFVYIVLVDCRNPPPKLKVQILDCCALTHLTRAADSSSLILYTNSKLHTLICVCLRRVKSIGFVAKRGGILIGCGKE